MERRAVSVIIPTNRGGPYLAEAVASLRAQTVAPDEVILVDDGSPSPGLAAVARELDVDLREEGCRRDRFGAQRRRRSRHRHMDRVSRRRRSLASRPTARPAVGADPRLGRDRMLHGRRVHRRGRSSVRRAVAGAGCVEHRYALRPRRRHRGSPRSSSDAMPTSPSVDAGHGWNLPRTTTSSPVSCCTVGSWAWTERSSRIGGTPPMSPAAALAGRQAGRRSIREMLRTAKRDGDTERSGAHARSATDIHDALRRSESR